MFLQPTDAESGYYDLVILGRALSCLSMLLPRVGLHIHTVDGLAILETAVDIHTTFSDGQHADSFMSKSVRRSALSCISYLTAAYSQQAAATAQSTDKFITCIAHDRKGLAWIPKLLIDRESAFRVRGLEITAHLASYLPSYLAILALDWPSRDDASSYSLLHSVMLICYYEDECIAVRSAAFFVCGIIIQLRESFAFHGNRFCSQSHHTGELLARTFKKKHQLPVI